MSELIAAVATPPGTGGVGILRLSGPGAARAAAQVFRPKGKRPLTEAPDRQLLYGTLLDREGRAIDTGLAFVSRAPHSYTGEETAELQCHGSPMVLSLVLEALWAAGARQARAGEFTQRAFLNGKLDLTQAEAVIDLIDAETPAAARQAAGQLEGVLSRRIEEIYSGLTDVMAHFCAVLDYPDEDIDPFQAQQLQEALDRQGEALQALLRTSRRGRLLTQGITCVLIGRPNAGKSSLLNALAGYERAIVTHIPGTTRDTVEGKITLAGHPFRLVDTAGLRDSDDPIEQLGVERSRAAMAQADLILMVCDGTQPWTDEDTDLLNQAVDQADTILVANKSDLPGHGTPMFVSDGTGHSLTVVGLSAKTGLGMELLEEALTAQAEALFPRTQEGAYGQLLTNQRQTDAVRRAAESVARASQALAAGITPDALLTDVEAAMAALGELTGKTLREDITSRIFERFCVGK
ncbi:MAG: tRNA uridine-5-carboxymethylaminomethyl(34) synthesis GTPase MnmE [Clostridiales bacterium]|nr:tRNA uridine-5-carboxymethylaminomethyl(34) synthesis GTPase MnmE [Clostridiales bacterium]MDY4171348.1 tRNA uridine-5-carboxymethylaminomethyl(34) synthesis GTPase MnmE [Evtepia sp.]